MAQTSNLDLDEDEIELTLGLSIGGCFHKRPPTSTITAVDQKESDGRDDDDDLQKRRELHALRRQEARKKREQKKNGHWNGNGNSFSVNNIISSSDSVALEVQRWEARARDRVAKENEGSGSDRRSGERNVDLTLTTNPNPNPNPSSGFSAYPTNGFTVMPPATATATATATAMQYPFHPMQCVPFGNGFHYPYMMPYWSPLQASESAMRVADGLRTEGYGAFRPFQPSDRDHSGDRRDGSDSGQNGSKGGVPSTGSTSSSSSAVSDNQSGSRRGGGSSETRSQSSRPPFLQSQPQVSLSQNPNHQSDQINIAHQIEPAQLTKEAAKIAIDKAQSDHPKPNHPTTPAIEPMPSTRSPPKSPPHSAPINRHSDDQDRKLGPPLPSLPHMPCVSTTGDGPNGKTITGFLYKYTKSEVSIVCVCHGRSFSPAEFIKHAGGTDISQPLKNIVVVPTNFG